MRTFQIDARQGRDFAERVALRVDGESLHGTSVRRLRAIKEDLLHAKVYARATKLALERAVEKLTEPFGQVSEFERKAG